MTASSAHAAGRRKMLTSLAFVVGGLAAFGLVAAMLLNQAAPEQHRKLPQITVLRLPPPPPPKPLEKPPEPPKIKEEVRLEQPKPVEQPQPDQPPPAGPLGLDAQGTGPGDGFGLVGRPGGRDITMGSGGGSGMGDAIYARGAARFIAQELARDERLRSIGYRVELLVWVAPDGRLEKYELVHGTGDSETDQLIRSDLGQVGAYRQSMPEKLKQPMRIRVTSTDAG